MEKTPDLVNHPPHYTNHPSGIECIDVVEHMGFNLGNAMKYIWRADLKGNSEQDLEKSIWYIRRELERRKRQAEAKTLPTSLLLTDAERTSGVIHTKLP